MAGRRQPIALVKAKGKKHLTKAEIAEREATEVKLPVAENVEAPECIQDDAELVAEFDEIVKQLVAVGIMSELDDEALARYLLSKKSYLHYTKELHSELEHSSGMEGILYIEKLQGLQDKAFKQVRAAANDLGLTISSRCRLVVPKVDTAPKENKFNKFK